MAFGLMTRKWGIYWRPLLVGLDCVRYIIEVVGRLHNFCINERILETGDSLFDPVAEANVTGHEMFQEMAEKLAKYEALAKALPGQSGRREDMVQWILHLGRVFATNLFIATYLVWFAKIK
jgi:hypothetical protein